MTFILGSQIPKRKVIRVGLLQIHGIGINTAKMICNELSINQETKVMDLTEEQKVSIQKYVKEQGIKVEGTLRREVKQNIITKKNIKSYQGRRHMEGKTVRGQNTRNNTGSKRKKSARGRK